MIIGLAESKFMLLNDLEAFYTGLHKLTTLIQFPNNR